MRRTLTLWVLIAGCAATPTHAQDPTAPPSAVLTGTVFDSLGGGPLAGAEVILGMGEASARTDALGRFTLRASPGIYVVGFQHRTVSPWPALHNRPRVTLVADGTLEVALATVSARTVLARTCGDGAVIGGVVQDLLTLVPLAGTFVDVRPRGRGMTTVPTSGDGAWFACLEDATAEVEVRARTGEARSRPMTLGAGAVVRVRDLLVPASRPAQLLGTVLDGPSGEGLEDASVELVGTRLRTVTGADGRFTFQGVPPGEIRVAVERLGYGRRVVSVEAEGGSTARVRLELFAEAIAADSVVVTVEGGGVDRDRLPTRFDGLTRAEIDRLLPRSMAFDDLLRNANVPGLKIRQVEYVSRSGVRQPGLCIETSRRSTMSQETCEMVEVYLNDIRVADPEMLLQSLDPGSIDRFQLLSATQAGIQYLGTPRARNGILLIWTRRR
jgi:hypothetical protein